MVSDFTEKVSVSCENVSCQRGTN